MTDPFDLFCGWMAEAEASEPNDPNAMCLATATADGAPSARMVLLKGVDDASHPARGFVFYTNLDSRKGAEIAANPRAALVFHWKSLLRSVRIEGPLAPVTQEEADAYYASRGRVSRLGAWASRQSRPLAARADLEAALAEAETRFPGEAIPRPPHWSGFRCTPARLEFWSDRPHRLHERRLFTRGAAGWAESLLNP